VKRKEALLHYGAEAIAAMHNLPIPPVWTDEQIRNEPEQRHVIEFESDLLIFQELWHRLVRFMRHSRRETPSNAPCFWASAR
jgi:hypothetical protein